MEGWLARTVELQAEAYGIRLPLTGEALADYVTWNVTALVAELGEVLQEIQWKPWATGRGEVKRLAMLQELVDVGFFLANLVAALGVTDAEWDAAYAAKRELNALRQRSGDYEG